MGPFISGPQRKREPGLMTGDGGCTIMRVSDWKLTGVNGELGDWPTLDIAFAGEWEGIEKSWWLRISVKILTRASIWSLSVPTFWGKWCYFEKSEGKNSKWRRLWATGSDRVNCWRKGAARDMLVSWKRAAGACDVVKSLGHSLQGAIQEDLQQWTQWGALIMSHLWIKL